jgi:hypothetical protein
VWRIGKENGNGKLCVKMHDVLLSGHRNTRTNYLDKTGGYTAKKSYEVYIAIQRC